VKGGIGRTAESVLNIIVFWDGMLYGLVDSYELFTLKTKVQVPLEHM
jgi:predicted Mrr-cat superfamily restriction endonuclease